MAEQAGNRSCSSGLVERRLLRREDRGGVQRVELTHDLLTGVVRASRDRRHQQEEAENVRVRLLEEQERERLLLQEQREDEERARAKRELSRTRRLAAIFAVLTIIAVAASAGAIRSRSQMQTVKFTQIVHEKRGARRAQRLYIIFPTGP